MPVRTDADVRASIDGDLYVGPLGTAVPPLSLDTPIPSPWVPVGYWSDAGLATERSIDRTDKFAFQNVDLVRTLSGEAYATFELSLIQESIDNVELVNNGVVDRATGKISVRVGSTKKQSFLFVILDGEYILFIHIPVGIIDEVGGDTYSSDELREKTITIKAYGVKGVHYDEYRSNFVTTGDGNV